MTFGQFISYCTLKGYITSHKERMKLASDVSAEKYYDLELRGRGYTARIRYAKIGERVAVITCHLSDARTLGLKIVPRADLGDIAEAFMPE